MRCHSSEPRGYRRDGRGRGRGSAGGEADRGQIVLGQAEPRGGIIVWGNVPAPRIEDPLGDLRPAAHRERDLYLPVAVGPLPGVPAGIIGNDAKLDEPLGDDLAEPRAWPGVARAADRGPLRLLSPVLALGENRALEAAHPLDRDSCRVGDLIGRLSGADPVLDLLGSQGTLHFDVVLGEPGELPASDGPQAVVDGQRETPAPSRHRENGVTAVLADCDEAQLVHRRPFRAAGRAGA